MNQTQKPDPRPETATEGFDQTAASQRDAATMAVKDATGTVKRKANEAFDTMQASVKDAMEDGRSRLDAVKEKAVEAKDAVLSGAGSTMEAVREAAVEKADSARETLSDVGDRLAETLKRAGETENSDALKSRVLNSVAHGLASASDALRQRSVTDLTSDIKTLARRHPGAFMAAAAVVGFAAARFVRSSAKRRRAERDDEHGPMA